MKKTTFVVVAAVLLSAGCASHQNCARTGWRFEVLKPPVIETQGAILVHQSPGLVGAQVLGSMQGPLAGPEPVPIMPAPRLGAPRECGPRLKPLAAPPAGGCESSEQE